MREASASVAEFCSLLPLLRERARKEGWSELLERTEEAVRACDATSEQVLEQLWVSLGDRGVRRRGGALAPPPGQDPAPPPDGAYRCPGSPSGHRCARRVERGPSEPVPECALHDLPLRFGTR